MFLRSVYYRRNNIRVNKKYRITLTRKNKNYALRKN